jgi:hypothetical protein
MQVPAASAPYEQGRDRVNRRNGHRGALVGQPGLDNGSGDSQAARARASRSGCWSGGLEQASISVVATATGATGGEAG